MGFLDTDPGGGRSPDAPVSEQDRMGPETMQRQQQQQHNHAGHRGTGHTGVTEHSIAR